MKIPILWRIERWFEGLKNKREQEEKEMSRGRNDNIPYGMVQDPRKQRTIDNCSNCGNTKFFKRKNNIKCIKCGWKKKIVN